MDDAPKAPALARLLDLPGRLGDNLRRGGDPERMPAEAVDQESLARAATRSPRANGWLSLEPGLRPFGDGDACLTWAAAHRSVLATGGLHVDPRCADADAARARLLSDYRDAARDAGYRRALVFPVHAHEAPSLALAGFDTLPVGSEALIDLSTFTLAGRKRADLRQMVNRASRRHGLSVTESGPAEAEGRAGPIFDAWLNARPLRTRMRLLVGSPGFEGPRGRRFFLCVDPGGEVQAFATVTPGWGGHGAGIDVMARSPAAPAGAMDLLVTRIIETLAAEGRETFSLGACPMALHAAERPRGLYRRLLTRAFVAIYRSRLMNRLFHFQSLVRFKAKFAPEWVPVHLGAWPRVDIRALYAGCRMWGLFGSDPTGLGGRYPALVQTT